MYVATAFSHPTPYTYTHSPRFFTLISEMHEPRDAMKVGVYHGINGRDLIWKAQAAWLLQGFATTFYAVFSVVVYVYIGSTAASPAMFSLPPAWSKATFAIGLGNFLVCVVVPLSTNRPLG